LTAPARRARRRENHPSLTKSSRRASSNLPRRVNAIRRYCATAPWKLLAFQARNASARELDRAFDPATAHPHAPSIVVAGFFRFSWRGPLSFHHIVFGLCRFSTGRFSGLGFRRSRVSGQRPFAYAPSGARRLLPARLGGVPSIKLEVGWRPRRFHNSVTLNQKAGDAVMFLGPGSARGYWSTAC
jgi:hypothetical protein